MLFSRSSGFKAFLLLALCLVLMAAIAYLVPIFANDYRYMLIEGTSERAQNLYDVALSQYRHYFDWGGRTVNHVIAMSLLLLDKLPRALVQAAAVCALLILINVHALGSLKKAVVFKPFNIFLAFAFLWLCLRYFGEVMISAVSSANYLYSTLILLFFLIPWRLNLGTAPCQRSRLSCLGMFVFGIIAGWTNENTGFALNFILGLWFLYLLIRHHVINNWQFCALLGSGLGFLLLVLSPGNAARMASMENKGFDYIEHLPKALEIFFLTLVCFHVLLIALIFMLYKLRCAQALTFADDRLKGAVLLVLIGLASLGIMIFSPNFPARTSTFCCVSLVIALIALKECAGEKGVRLLGSNLQRFLLGLFGIYFVLTYGNALLAAYEARQDQILRDQEIAAAIARGEQEIVVSPFKVQSFKYLDLPDIRANPNYFSNQILKRFFMLDGSIRRKCDPSPRAVALDFRILTAVGKPICE